VLSCYRRVWACRSGQEASSSTACPHQQLTLLMQLWLMLVVLAVLVVVQLLLS
jgi:hypothetical protein